MADLATPTTVDLKPVGKLTGGGPLAVPGSFLSIARGPFAVALIGARAAATTHDETTRAPTLVTDDTPTFHCPLWPQCGCPGGTMRPECPGLKSRIGVK